MLDFDPEGLGQISDVTAYLIGGAIIAFGLAVACGAVLFAAGRNGGVSRTQEKGFRMVGISLAAVAVVSSLGGAFSWSTGLGQSQMMPSEARQQDIVIERQAPTTTCTDHAELNFEDDDEEVPNAEREEILNELAGRDIEVPWDEGSDEERITELRWYPIGPDCSAENISAAEGTYIEWEARVRDGGMNNHQSGTTRLVTDERQPICAVEGTCDDDDDDDD